MTITTFATIVLGSTLIGSSIAGIGVGVKALVKMWIG